MSIEARKRLFSNNSSPTTPTDSPNKRGTLVQKITNQALFSRVLRGALNQVENSDESENDNDYETESEIDEDEIFQVKTLKQIESEKVLNSQEVSDLVSALKPFSKKKYKTDVYVNTLFDKKKINLRRQRKTRRRFNPFLANPQRRVTLFGKNKKEDTTLTEDSSSSDSSEEVEEEKPEEEKLVKRKRGISKFVKSAIKSGVRTGQGALVTGKNVAVRTGEVLNPMNIVDHGYNAIASVASMGQQVNDSIENQRKKNLTRKIKRVNEDGTEHVSTLKMVNTNIDQELMNDVYVHYPLFIRTSKQISTIDTEMVELGQLWGEMKSSMQSVDECLSELANIKTITKSRGPKSSIAKASSPTGIKPRSGSEGVEFQVALGDIINNLRSAVELRDIDSAIELYQVGIRDFISSHASSSIAYNLKGSNTDRETLTVSEINNQLTYMADLEVIETFKRTVDQLATELCIELSQHWKLTPSKTKKLTKQLTLLERHREALRTYLDSQEDRIRGILSKEIAGLPLVYVEAISQLFFGLIQEICEEFEEVFGTDYNSEFVRWVVDQLMGQYIVLIETQVLKPYHDSLVTTIRSCDIAFTHADKLSAKGIAITYLLRDHFRDEMEFALRKYIETTNQTLSEKMHKETWGVSELIYTDLETGEECTAQVTETGKILYQFMKEFSDCIEPVVSVQLYQSTVRGVQQLLQSCYITCYTLANTHSRLNDSQFFSMISTIQLVIQKLFPGLLNRLTKMFERDIPELTLFEEQTYDFDQKLIDLYCRIRSSHIMEQIGFHSAKYPPLQHSLGVSQQFQNLLLFLSKLGQTLTEYGNFTNKEIILPKLMEKLITLISNDGMFWHRLSNVSGNLRKLTADDIQIVILDMYFLLEAGRFIMFHETRDKVHELIDKMGKEFYKTENDNDDDDGTVLKENDFYYQFIDDLIKSKPLIKTAQDSFEKNFKNADFEALRRIVSKTNKVKRKKKAVAKKQEDSEEDKSDESNSPRKKNSDDESDHSGRGDESD